MYTMSAYPLIKTQQDDFYWVKRTDVYTGRKEVGGDYDEQRLNNVEKAFKGDGELTPIKVKVTLQYDKIKYRVLDGYHRLKVCEKYNIEEIPVKYEQAEFEAAAQELAEKKCIPSAEKKYIPPHKRNQKI